MPLLPTENEPRYLGCYTARSFCTCSEMFVLGRGATCS